MRRSRQIGMIVLLLSSTVSTIWAIVLQRTPHPGITDFRIVYTAARCLVQHRDPYQESEFLRVFQEEGRSQLGWTNDRQFQDAVMAVVYLPTALFLMAPFAMFGWTAANILWTILTIGLFTLACFLIWSIASDSSPPLAAFLCAIMLANAEILYAFGNAAGIAISLCTIAVWTFVTQRFVFAGPLCLAMSLAIKPHDSIAIWFYFLVAGGFYRKRALQALSATIILCIPAILWVSDASPNWPREIRFNLETVGARGGITDPGPAGISHGTGGMIINFQSVASIIWDDPRFYNAATCIVCVPLFAAWLIATLRNRNGHARVWLALAALVPLALLPVYHRPYDAKLLLLAVPACASMWRQGGLRRWIALATTSAGIVLTSDIPETLLVMLSSALPRYPVGFSEKSQVILLARPIPLALLVMCIFYLWEYFRQSGTAAIESRDAKLRAD